MKIRKSVMQFAETMERVLRENDFKSGWHNESLQYLKNRLADEYEEYRQSADPKELIDIANFCMMIYHKLQQLKEKREQWKSAKTAIGNSQTI